MMIWKKKEGEKARKRTVKELMKRKKAKAEKKRLKEEQKKEDEQKIIVPIFKEKKIYKHMNTVCDHCLTKDFIGKRYQCVDCGDYDLCEKCFDLNSKKVKPIHDKSHVYKVYEIPEEMKGETYTVQIEEKKPVVVVEKEEKEEKEEKDEIYPMMPQEEEQSDYEKYAEQLGLLADMGFDDKEKLITLLKQSDGDVQSVVSTCLSQF